jgi:hypothetical protein
MRRHRPVPIAVLCGLLVAAVAAPTAAQDPSEAPATQLRVALDRVLAEHAFLIVEVMHTGLTPNAEFEAAGDALDANTNDLVAAITSVYGKAAGDAFAEQWRNHIGFIVDYARALNDKDTSSAQLADSQLRKYVTDFSALLAGAVALPAATVEGLIREHVEQLEQVASFETSRFGEAYPAIRETYAHMFMIGDGLATAIVAQSPDKFTGRQFAFSAATDLRLKLDSLLGEHTELAALAMRARLTDSPDVAASAAALDDNTKALAAAIASIYGASAGAAFEAQWQNHTELYLAYVAAKKANDSAAQAAALAGIRSYQTSFTSFLVEANPLVSATQFHDLIGEHTNQLITEADQYAAGDYAAAYTTGRTAFAHSGVLSAYLASAISQQFPDRFPGNTATSPATSDLQLIGVMLVLLGVSLMVRRSRVPQRAVTRIWGRRPTRR